MFVKARFGTKMLFTIFAKVIKIFAKPQNSLKIVKTQPFQKNIFAQCEIILFSPSMVMVFSDNF